jgi:Protein of unknown function (DUF2630)
MWLVRVGRAEGAQVNDDQVLSQIERLVAEEHDLYGKGAEMSDEEHRRLREVQVRLDQCWDLLRQRRAREEFGLDPDEARTRDEGTVEGYRQ